MLRRPSSGILVLLAGLLLTLPVQADDSLVAEFRSFYGKDRSERERVEAVRVLADVHSLPAAQALLPVLEDESFAVRQAAIETLGANRGAGVGTWLIEEVLTSRKLKRKKDVRAAAAEALGLGGHSEALEALKELLDDRDEQLKVAGVRALGHLGDASACPELSTLAGDDDAFLTVVALDALARIGSADGARDAVIAAVSHADNRVRGRAIRAVLELRLKAGVRPLIERMRVETGRLAGDAFDVLRELTLRKFPDSPDVWSAWWDRNENVFELPDPELVAAARKRLAEEGSRYVEGKKSFLGVETKSENIMFVIDVSGSMETRFDDPDRLASTGREYASLQRLAIVKEELIATIEGLSPSTSFNILAFATEVDPWRKTSTKANVLQKNNARAWIERLQPLGGSSASFRATSGLSVSDANVGATNTHLALMTALGEEVEEGERLDGFVLEPGNDIDTIFFLTDGDPTIGKTVDMLEIRGEVSRVNAYRGVQIHVIYVGAVGGKDLQLLATENGGMFVNIGG